MRRDERGRREGQKPIYSGASFLYMSRDPCPDHIERVTGIHNSPLLSKAGVFTRNFKIPLTHLLINRWDNRKSLAGIASLHLICIRYLLLSLTTTLIPFELYFPTTNSFLLP
jgi:hypothetical protein